MRVLAVVLLLILGFAPGAVRAGAAEPDEVVSEWSKYRARFITADGRVLDTGNQHVSHTEGQGWAMLFAEASGDRAAFDTVWHWTRQNLQHREGALFAWRWNPAEEKPIADKNNATDGDILIAWALVRASRHWNDPDHTRAARRILCEIRAKLLHRAAKRLVLLPGHDGFRNEDGTTVVNPSYYIFPALKDFARIMPAPEWPRLRRDGLALLSEARFGRWGLPPDWVAFDGSGKVAPASKFPARFGFDAIRIPLYLIWAREATPERLASFLDFWNGFGTEPIPAWTDLNDNSLAPYPAGNGFHAIVELARSYDDPQAAALPAIGDKDEYYSASLTLLAHLVRRELSQGSHEPAADRRPTARPGGS